MIEAKNISKSYRIQGQKKIIFHNLSLSINKGARLAVVGANGAGKSTLLRLLAGVEKPNKGKIHRSSTLSWPVGVGTGFLPTLTGCENVKFVCRLFALSKKERDERIDYVRHFADIGDYFYLPMRSYSTGMRSRLSFGMSMAFDFDFYVVDETLSVGDKLFKKKCIAAFKAKAEGKGLLMVSHNMNTIKDFCNQGLFLHNGTCIYDKDVNKVIKLYNHMK